VLIHDLSCTAIIMPFTYGGITCWMKSVDMSPNITWWPQI